MTEPFIPDAQIKVDLQGVGLDTSNKWREIIETLITQGAFSVKNGKVIMNFDHEGNLMEISFDFKKWRRGKNS